MLLTSVRDGGSPSVSTTGEMVMLDWTERRSDIRYLVDKQVWVHVNSEHKRANLVDISVSGCGLSNCDGLSSGDMASIELTSGRILTGFVMWARVDRAGLRLLQPLSRNDVLLNPTNSNAARST